MLPTQLVRGELRLELSRFHPRAPGHSEQWEEGGRQGEKARETGRWERGQEKKRSCFFKRTYIVYSMFFIN